jgi:signal transduction histidine kinase
LVTSFKLRNFFLGKEVIASRSEFKRLMLTGTLALICIAVGMIYALLDLLHQVYYAFPAYALLLAMPIFSLFLMRSKHYKSAKVILLISTNLVVFWAALNDPFETGAFMFFIPIGIGSFAVLAFDDHRIGIALTTFTTFLFLLAYFGDFHPIAVPRPSEIYIRISFLFNYFISLTTSVLAVYFLMRLNRRSESELMQKEKFAIQKNKELQKVNDELDRFVYSVSHDLRSPLSSILGLTNLALKTYERAELEQILKMIQGRVHAQDHFIREIIDYSRNARTETTREQIYLKPLVDGVIDALKFNNHADKITFHQQIPDDIVLFSDKIRLTVILSNLIGNAIKYHDLKKQNPFIEIGYREDVSAIYVQDNGIGVLPDDQEKIFHMFYRGSDRSTGSGLGLFITREAVTKLKGSIEVKSVYGEGSTFLIYFKANKE